MFFNILFKTMFNNMFLYIKRNKSGYPWILMEPKKLLLMVDDDLWVRNQKIVNPWDLKS